MSEKATNTAAAAVADTPKATCLSSSLRRSAAARWSNFSAATDASERARATCPRRGAKGRVEDVKAGAVSPLPRVGRKFAVERRSGAAARACSDPLAGGAFALGLSPPCSEAALARSRLRSSPVRALSKPPDAAPRSATRAL